MNHKGERPVNVDASNIVWLNSSNTTWTGSAVNSASAKAPELAFLWGDPNGDQVNGTLVKLPAGFSGKLSSSTTFRAVVIQGQINLRLVENDAKALTPGSYFGSEGKATHRVSCDTGECLIYVRTIGKYDIVPDPSEKQH